MSEILTFTLQQYSIISHKEILKFLVNIEESTPSSSKHIRQILSMLNSVLFSVYCTNLLFPNMDMAVLVFAFSPCAVQTATYCYESNCFEKSLFLGRSEVYQARYRARFGLLQDAIPMQDC